MGEAYMDNNYKHISDIVSDGLVRASSSMRRDKVEAYEKALSNENNEMAKWVLMTDLENEKAAKSNHSPLCDDTGIPHLILDVGGDYVVTGNLLDSIYEGIDMGLRRLPGRPMSLIGDDLNRIDQSGGINPDSDGVKPAPILIRRVRDNAVRLHILMLGGGPEIRTKTYRIFHKHNTQIVFDEIVEWATDGVKQLGCSPCTIAIGIGRTHYEATALMLQAQVDGRYDKLTEIEQEITRRVNSAGIGALGLGGSTSVLATFLKVGEQRASGVRIVSVRPCCCVEPRVSTVDLRPDATNY